MAEKTVAQKLFVRENYRVLILNEPENYMDMLGELPGNVKLLKKLEQGIDLIQFFVTSRQLLEKELPGLKQALNPNGLLWITYPKGTSKMKADINRDSINTYAKSIGLQGVAMISVDETWSALRLKIV